MRPKSFTIAAGGLCGGLAEDGLDLEGDRDLVAYDDAATVHRQADVDAEVRAVDLGAGGEAGALAAVRVGGEAVELEVQRDVLGDAVQRQVAVERPGPSPFATRPVER